MGLSFKGLRICQKNRGHISNQSQNNFGVHGRKSASVESEETRYVRGPGPCSASCLFLCVCSYSRKLQILMSGGAGEGGGGRGKLKM